MKFLLFLTAFVGMALTEDLKCYSCKDANQFYVPCGGAVREKLELCNIPVCTNMQIRWIFRVFLHCIWV
ncbi:hypothetical protein TCAL_13384 [Tigriopus californicus]|uniref:Uncharacterized protein n=1 Tax=Tigriopus californicus TaxID=6832 RepID=A0A553PSU3_TIGCA|nr:hypothetical protein TCAL_13384 [Tigriopus californicus]